MADTLSPLTRCTISPPPSLTSRPPACGCSCTGMKSRGVYETPGGTVLLTARRAMESITLDRGEAHLKVHRQRSAATRPAAVMAGLHCTALHHTAWLFVACLSHHISCCCNYCYYNYCYCNYC